VAGVVFNSAGAKVITATYNDVAVPPTYASSSGSLGFTVNKGTPTVIIGPIAPVVPPPGGPFPNQDIAVTVTVIGAGVPPTGTVAISISGVPTQVVTCTITLSILPAPPPHGTCNISFNASGMYTINAVYSGDQNYTGGTAAVPYVVP